MGMLVGTARIERDIEYGVTSRRRRLRRRESSRKPHLLVSTWTNVNWESWMGTIRREISYGVSPILLRTSSRRRIFGFLMGISHGT